MKSSYSTSRFGLALDAFIQYEPEETKITYSCFHPSHTKIENYLPKICSWFAVKT